MFKLNLLHPVLLYKGTSHPFRVKINQPTPILGVHLRVMHVHNLIPVIPAIELIAYAHLLGQRVGLHLPAELVVRMNAGRTGIGGVVRPAGVNRPHRRNVRAHRNHPGGLDYLGRLGVQFPGHVPLHCLHPVVVHRLRSLVIGVLLHLPIQHINIPVFPDYDIALADLVLVGRLEIGVGVRVAYLALPIDGKILGPNKRTFVVRFTLLVPVRNQFKGIGGMGNVRVQELRVIVLQGGRIVKG